MLVETADAPTQTVAAASALTADAPTDAGPTDADLLDALKKARKAVGDQQKPKLMATMVVPTEVLELVVKQKPTTLAQLGDVEGFGPTRAERYGAPLLACIISHVAATASPDAADASSTTDAPAAAADVASTASTAPAATAKCTVKYNHYSKEFTLTGGVLKFEDVDEQYALAYVFKGQFSAKLSTSPSGGSGETVGPDGGRLDIGENDEGERVAKGTFSGLTAGAVYTVIIDEDPALAKAPAGKSYKFKASAAGGGGGGGFSRAIGGSKGRGSALVTAELKKLSADQLREGGAEYRALLEARDLEDAFADGDADDDDDDAGAVFGEDKSSCSCIYGNPCLQASSCKDWRNRYEVAKKHGWKGF